MTTTEVRGTWMNLRYAGKCKTCGRGVAKGDRGFYSRDEKKVLCSGCAVAAGIASDPDPSRKVDPNAAPPTYKSASSASYASPDLALTQEVISFLKLVTVMDGHDDPVPLAPGATALLQKIIRSDKAAPIQPTVHSAEESIVVGLDPVEAILRCPTCSILTDPHECKENR